MRIPAAGPYVCWRCLSRGAQPGIYPPRAAGLARGSLRGNAGRGLAASLVNRRSFATVQETPKTSSQDEAVPDIRQRLRRWEAENHVPAPIGAPADNGSAGQARNILTRPRQLDELGLEEETRSELVQPLPDSDGLLDLLPPPSDFGAGDLLEIQEDADRLSLLAVCLGNRHGIYHFYTITGKWYPTHKAYSKFVLRNFVDQQLLQPAADKLPKEGLPFETLKAMSDLKMGPDRESGSVLLRIMHKFQQDVETATQKYATRLENAHEILANCGKDRYFTLQSAAATLIGEQGIKTGNISPPILCAVHRAIIAHDVGFRVAGMLGPAKKTVYEVTAPEDVLLVHNMQTLVRLFTDIPGKVGVPMSALKKSDFGENKMGRFVEKAREAIIDSRRYRDWTPHGTLGPAKVPKPPVTTSWNDVDLSILRFMHLWAGYGQFSPSSSFQTIGSTILRAIGLYKDSEDLSASTGWTFLQEVGYLTPWDMRSRHTSRVPGVSLSRKRGFERMRLGPDGISANLEADRFAGKRKEWTGHTVFAIDSKNTVDIDDAVSIEKTDNPDEHWIHVHVADPASRIRHVSSLAKRAQMLPLNLYLSGHESNIWGVGNELQQLFSLGPGRPCLTFSGKVNSAGDLLEYNVSPGQLKDIVFITHEEVNRAVGFEDPRRPPPWSSVESFRVGQPPSKKPENRKMVTASELRQDELELLKALHRLAIAIQGRRLAKGSVPVYPLRANASVLFDETSCEEAPSGVMTCNGDPSIEISWGGGSEAPLVTNTMVLAGEVAARWCVDRQVPIPFVKQPVAQENLEVLKAYTERVYYPILLRGEQPSIEQSVQFFNLVGPDEVSSRPGPHFVLGVDAYAKVTSPLRRYSDILAHWQIEHALLQEMEEGKVDTFKLPFRAARLDKDVFPWMLLRQRIIRRLGNLDGHDAYIRQALFRAWKYPSEHDSKLPGTFLFTVSRALGRCIVGWLDWFGLESLMFSDGLAKLGLQVSDLRRGDVLEVKLKDLNLHVGDVLVEPIGRVSAEK